MILSGLQLSARRRAPASSVWPRVAGHYGFSRCRRVCGIFASCSPPRLRLSMAPPRPPLLYLRHCPLPRSRRSQRAPVYLVLQLFVCAGRPQRRPRHALLVPPAPSLLVVFSSPCWLLPRPQLTPTPFVRSAVLPAHCYLLARPFLHPLLPCLYPSCPHASYVPPRFRLPTCFVLVNVFTDCIRGVGEILFLRCCVRPADPALCSAWLKQFQHTTEPSRTLSRIVHSLLNESGLYLHPVRPGRLITEPATSSL